MAIKKCTCDHKGPGSQDELHGEGNRVFNCTAKDTLKCTVCNKEQAGSRADKEKTKDNKKGKK